ncbi:MAG TPA: heavy-metal-associated domain-containing protein [Acidimicrobiales bacterium]|nr:heavy-metal-associated domain-containing protein [Acidimicrobiales bacterium]
MAAEAVTFTVTGMHCASCGMFIDETLEDLAGVEQADTDARRGRTTVRADLGVTSVGEIVAAIGEAGYAAVPKHS